MHIIDTHNHSLPGIDDGAKDLAMALAMLHAAEAAGTKEVVLTPHHLNGAYINHADFIQQQVSRLDAAAKSNGINVVLHAASEVHLTPETVEHLVEYKALSYCGLGKAALIELPKSDIPNGVEAILSELLSHGITPIIAHPERNTPLRVDFSRLRDWVNMGCKAQLTGQSCTGAFGVQLQKSSLAMISNGLIHLVASDAHRPSGRSPNLQQAAEFLTAFYDAQVCQTLLVDNPARLISGRDLVLCKPVESGKEHPAKSWWQRLVRLD